MALGMRTECYLNTLRPRQNGRHLSDDIFKCIFLNKNAWISVKLSLKFVPKVPINNIQALVLIMAWRRPGDTPLFETMMDSLPTHICVTRRQWVNIFVHSSLNLFHASIFTKVYLWRSVVGRRWLSKNTVCIVTGIFSLWSSRGFLLSNKFYFGIIFDLKVFVVRRGLLLWNSYWILHMDKYLLCIWYIILCDTLYWAGVSGPR